MRNMKLYLRNIHFYVQQEPATVCRGAMTEKVPRQHSTDSLFERNIKSNQRNIQFYKKISSFMCNKFAVVRRLRKCLVSITVLTATLALVGGT